MLRRLSINLSNHAALPDYKIVQANCRHEGIHRDYCWQIEILFAYLPRDLLNQYGTINYQQRIWPIIICQIEILGYRQYEQQRYLHVRLCAQAPWHALAIHKPTRRLGRVSLRELCQGMCAEIAWAPDRIKWCAQSNPDWHEVMQFGQASDDWLRQRLTRAGCYYQLRHKHGHWYYEIHDHYQQISQSHYQLSYVPLSQQITQEAIFFDYQLCQRPCASELQLSLWSWQHEWQNAQWKHAQAQTKTITKLHQLVAKGSEDVTVLLQRWRKIEAANQWLWQIKSFARQIQPGDRITLANLPKSLQAWQHAYVLSVDHFWRFSENSSDYYNQVSLLASTELIGLAYIDPDQQCVRVAKDVFPNPNHAHLSTWQNATIAGKNTEEPGQLNQYGAYPLSWDFEINLQENHHPVADERLNHVAEQSSQIGLHIPRLADFGGQQQNGHAFGEHWPLTQGTRVLTGFFLADESAAFIMGTLPTDQQASVINANNAQSMCLNTRIGQQLLNDESQKLWQINSPGQQEQLVLATGEEARIELKSRQGDIHWRSGSNLHWQTHRGFSQQAFSIHSFAQQNYQLISQQGNIRLTAGSSIFSFSGQHSNLYSQKKFTLQSDHQIRLIAGKNITVYSQAEMLVDLAKAKMQVVVDKALDWQAVAGVEFANQQTFMNFSAQGHNSIAAKQVHLIAEEVHIFSGGRIQAGAQAQSINVKLKQDEHEQQTTQVSSQQAGSQDKKKSSHYPMAQQTRNMQNVQHLQAPIIINLRRQTGKSDIAVSKQLSQQAIQYFKKNGNNVLIFIHGYNVPMGKFAKQSYYLEKKAHSIDYVNQENYCLDGAKFHYHLQTHEIVSPCYIYRYPQQVYSQTHNPWLQAQQQWLSQQFPHDKIVVNNIALIDAMEQAGGFTIDYADKVELNGTGAHAWWLDMEHNFNSATGQHDQNNYQKYTRLLNIAWQGDPSCAIDYMTAVEEAELVALKVSDLIQHLIAQGLQVNMVAHSLGCYVAIRAMQSLALKKQKLAHVFLWQPAVPSNIFSPKLPASFLDQRYHCPQAIHAVEKLTILYSQNDNILGGVNENLSPKTLYLEKTENDLQNGAIYSIMALVIYQIEKQFRLPNKARSIYFIANLLQEPISHLLRSSNLRQQVFQAWRAHCPLELVLDHRGQQKLEPYAQDLLQQKNKIKTNNVFQQAYDWLSLIFYVAKLLFLEKKSKLLVLRDTLKICLQQHPIKLLLNEIIMAHNGHDPLRLIARAIRMYRWYHGQEKQIRLSPYFGLLIDDQVANDMAALIIAKLSAGNNHILPQQALGYSGMANAKYKQRWIRQGLLVEINQTPWLFTHSAMRLPSANLFEQVYCQRIWQQNSDFQFGCYRQSAG